MDRNTASAACLSCFLGASVNFREQFQPPVAYLQPEGTAFRCPVLLEHMCKERFVNAHDIGQCLVKAVAPALAVERVIELTLTIVVPQELTELTVQCHGLSLFCGSSLLFLQQTCLAKA